jgi:hypothetical protein
VKINRKKYERERERGRNFLLQVFIHRAGEGPKNTKEKEVGVLYVWTAEWICKYALTSGQSELTATNAPVGRSVHWMGCVFSFGAGWGSSQSISFCC